MQTRVRRDDTILLSGWLFADLLLALAVIFLAANIGIPPTPVIPPTLEVNPLLLNANTENQGCKGGPERAQCEITILAKSSQGDVKWSISSDIRGAEGINYSQKSGTLASNTPLVLTLSQIPCQYGSFTVRAELVKAPAATSTAAITFQCVPPEVKPERLNLTPESFTLSIKDLNAFLNGNSQNDDIKQQIRNKALLQGRNVGIAIVYGSAPTLSTSDTDQALAVSQKIYNIIGEMKQEGFTSFARLVPYKKLYNVKSPSTEVDVDVFFFTR